MDREFIGELFHFIIVITILLIIKYNYGGNDGEDK